MLDNYLPVLDHQRVSRVGQLVARVGRSARVPCWDLSECPVLDSQCECPVLDKVIVAHVLCRTQ